MEAVNALSTLSQVSETQLDTEAIMHELSVDSAVTFRKVMGSAEILPTRQSFDPNEVIPGPWMKPGQGPLLHLHTGVAYS